MRHTIIKDYDLIESELKKLRNESNIDNEILNQEEEIYSINGISSNQGYSMRCDVRVLSAQLVKYFELTNKNFKFESFYEKKIMDLFKALVKDENEFHKFLEMTGLDIEDFIHIAIYIVPQCFTSNLIKFLRQHYLNK